MASITKQPKEIQEKHRKLLLNMLKLEENRECADCRTRNPTWASINLGIFVCIRCSGLHRQIGTHITKVRSCTMDIWTPEQINFMSKMGNKNAKRIWEHQLPADYGKPSEGEDDQLVLQWIRTKYEKRKFMHSNPEAVLMEINAEAKAAEENRGGRAGPRATGSGINRKSKATATPLSPSSQLAQMNQQQRNNKNNNNSEESAPSAFTNLDGNVPSSFGGGGFGFGNTEETSSSNTGNGGGFGFMSGSSNNTEEAQQSSSSNNNNNNADPNSPEAIQAALLKQQEELQRQMKALMEGQSSGNGSSQQQEQKPVPQQVSSEQDTTPSSFGFSADANNTGGGGFSFTQQQDGQQQQTGGGFGFMSASSTNNNTNNTKNVSSDALVDAIFSAQQQATADGNFQNFVNNNPSSPLDDPPIVKYEPESAQAMQQKREQEARQKQKGGFDPFSVLAGLGQLKQTSLTDVSNPTTASPITSSFAPNSQPGSNPNSQTNFVWGSRQDSSTSQQMNVPASSFASNNNDNQNQQQEAEGFSGGGFGFASSSSPDDDQNQQGGGGGFGFTSNAATAESEEAPQQPQPVAGTSNGNSSSDSAESQALIEQLKKQQEMLMQQMAQFQKQ